jgi:hypothetical protein
MILYEPDFEVALLISTPPLYTNPKTYYNNSQLSEWLSEWLSEHSGKEGGMFKQQAWRVMQPWRWLLVPLLLLLMIGFVACGGQAKEPSRWDTAQEQSTGNQPATSEEAVAGSTFNALFPSPEGDFDLVFTQEKVGFAEAKLTEGGTDMALLSISDTVNNPQAVEKYQSSCETLAGYPLASSGSKGTAILVADRFQVQVRSLDNSFDETDRKEWLQQFDLSTLAKQ